METTIQMGDEPTHNKHEESNRPTAKRRNQTDPLQTYMIANTGGRTVHITQSTINSLQRGGIKPTHCKHEESNLRSKGYESMGRILSLHTHTYHFTRKPNQSNS
eukprot:450201_1